MVLFPPRERETCKSAVRVQYLTVTAGIEVGESRAVAPWKEKEAVREPSQGELGVHLSCNLEDGWDLPQRARGGDCSMSKGWCVWQTDFRVVP